MKLGIINSAFEQVGMDTRTGLEHIARIGFDCVDIFTEAMELKASQARDIERTCRQLKLPIISLPVVAVGLIDFNAPVRRFHVERCKRFMDLANRWGASIFIGPRRIHLATRGHCTSGSMAVGD